MNPVRFNWDEKTNQLILHTPVGLTDFEMHNAKSYAFNVFKQRYANLPAGDRKDGVRRVLEALRDNRICQHVTGKTSRSVERVILRGI
jgi:hypothetical protein